MYSILWLHNPFRVLSQTKDSFLNLLIETAAIITSIDWMYRPGLRTKISLTVAANQPIDKTVKTKYDMGLVLRTEISPVAVLWV